MLNATVSGRIDITDELIIYQIRPDGPIPDFEPGQYVALGLPGAAPRPSNFPAEHEQHAPDKIIKRAYSIGSPPTQKEYIEFYIAIAPQGALTSRLVLLRPGDRLFMNPKITGTFTLTGVPPEHNLVMVSTGTGIAPYMAMLRHAPTWTPGRKITLLHGVRYSRDFAYRDELLGLEQSNPAFRYLATVSREDSDWHGDRGYVQSYFKDGRVALDSAQDHVFLCGNPAMVEEIEKLLTGRGYTEHTRRQPGNLHLEKYW